MLKKDILENDFLYIYRWSKNLIKRQRGRIYHVPPCWRKTSWTFHIFINGEKNSKKREREDLASLSRKDTLNFQYIFIYGVKKFKKKGKERIYHPFRRKTPWRTIFHIFIDVNIPYIYRVKIWQRDREGRFTIFVEKRHRWNKKNSIRRERVKTIFHIYRWEKIEKKTEREDLLSLSKKDTLENDFPYIYSAKKFKKETERKNSPSLSKKDILDFPYIYQWGKKFEKEEEDGFTILVKERHLGLSIYLSMEKKNSKKKKRMDLASLSYLGEQFFIYLSVE